MPKNQKSVWISDTPKKEWAQTLEASRLFMTAGLPDTLRLKVGQIVFGDFIIKR